MISFWYAFTPYGFWELQYPRLSRDFPVFDRFPVFICISFVWIYIYMLSFNCYRKKHKTGPGIFILETRVWHIAWWPVRTGTGSPVSVYERFEPDICNITLNHDVGSVFSSIFTGNLVMIFWENMGNVGSWMWQSCSNVRWLPDILLYPRFAAKSLNNCF